MQLRETVADELGVWLVSTPDAASARIRGRISELEAVRANYVGYLPFRIAERDWHGAWDASVNISETECEISGLKFALECLGTPWIEGSA